MSLRFQFCTHPWVCILNFLKKSQIRCTLMQDQHYRLPLRTLATLLDKSPTSQLGGGGGRSGASAEWFEFNEFKYRFASHRITSCLSGGLSIDKQSLHSSCSPENKSLQYSTLLNNENRKDFLCKRTFQGDSFFNPK